LVIRIFNTLSVTQRFQPIVSINFGLTKATLPTKISPLLYKGVAAIARITNGNFRLLNRLFRQIQRVIKINELNCITAEVVEAARECLVIGAI
jgi:Holliday junction resolvasome RuvABC ATP-dependent DNA helicase subunit